MPKDHNIDEERGGAATTTPTPTPHIQGGSQQGPDSLEEQLPVVQQEVGLFELPALVLDVGARVHPVVNFDESLAPLLLSHL